MNLEELIKAMPKVELNIRLEGLFRKDTLVTIAEQNEIPATMKRFREWLALLDTPDYKRLDEIVTTVAQWIQQPDDLTRLVYDLGVDLSKQNVRYAEVIVNPVTHMPPGWTLDEFMSALNDGRDRVQRAWGVRLAWIIVVPREEPRRADDLSRWVANNANKRKEIVSFGVVGQDDTQPIAQFERAFNAVSKKDVPIVIEAGNTVGAEAILEAFELNPARIVGGRGAADAPDVLQHFADTQVPLVISVSQALCLNWVDKFADYPLHQLYENNINLVISADMPSLFKSTLTDAYLGLIEHSGFSLEEVQELALNAVRNSFLPPDEKTAMLEKFQEEYAQLSSELAASEPG